MIEDTRKILRQQLRKVTELSETGQRKKMLEKTVRQWADGTARSVCRMLCNDRRALRSLPADVRGVLGEWYEWELAARRWESERIDTTPDVSEGTATKQQVTAAIENLLEVASQDTGQSRRTANFLLAWWNAGDNGGFDLTDLWMVDQKIAEDMLTIFSFLAKSHENEYPAAFVARERIVDVSKRWRPRDEWPDEAEQD